MRQLKEIPFKKEKPIFEKLEQILDIANLSPEELEEYEQSLERYTELQYDLAVEYGVEQGRQGEKLDIARKMKAVGVPVETITSCTSLSFEEINAL